MQRNLVTLATVISIKPSGENNASVCFLTKEEGVVYGILYGGRKSRLRSLVSTWNTGILYLSFSKGSYKISDFDVKEYHPSFRENIFKSCAASLAAEVALKTKCAGNSEVCWALVNGFLHGLDVCQAQDAAVSGLIRFLWRYLELLGLQPDGAACARCGELLYTGGFYAQHENCFLCSNCAKSGYPVFVGGEGLRYLSFISSVSPAEAASSVVPADSVDQLKNLLYFLIENACDSVLLSLKTGAGVL